MQVVGGLSMLHSATLKLAMTAVETIVASVRALNPAEREELRRTLDREALLRQDDQGSRAQAVNSVFGKYAHVPIKTPFLRTALRTRELRS